MTAPMDDKQLHLELDDPRALIMDPADIDARAHIRPLDLRRATLAWLADEAAVGLATKVPTRISRFRADVAGFWNGSARNRQGDGPRHLLVPTRTVIVECRPRRRDCWPDVNNSAELIPQFRERSLELRRLECAIRHQEPHLRDDDMLFAEYSEWHYEHSANPAYHSLRKEVRKLEAALYKGSRFETIRRAHLADQLYLAVPRRAVHPAELAEGWGLLWVDEDFGVELVRPADPQHCEVEHRLHLVQNIAAAAADSVLFANGVYREEEETVFQPVPRRRRPSRQAD